VYVHVTDSQTSTHEFLSVNHSHLTKKRFEKANS